MACREEWANPYEERKESKAKDEARRARRTERVDWRTKAETMSSGMVYLVGAGAGEAGQLTLAGAEILARADCVIHDGLIDRRLLDLAPAAAERVDVGKRGGQNHAKTLQEAIQRLLIDRARNGKTVVRLKGGDPLLFARGGEEAIALQEAGLAYEIVPGVTAALSAAAAASIPLTHRGVASAVAFVTGHCDPANDHHLDWSALAQFPGTLVLYMVLRNLDRVARSLLEHGKSGDTPLALVEWAGTNRQRVVETTLSSAAESDSCPLRSPVIAIVGEVCRLRGRLGWFERRPLFGQRVLVLRPPHQSSSLVRRLESLGADVLTQPVFTIEPPEDWRAVDDCIARIDSFDWIVFRSPNGVHSFLGRLWGLGLDMRNLMGARLAAIGPGTADALSEHHLRADLVPDRFDADSLADALRDRVVDRSVLCVRANRGRTVLEDALAPVARRVECVTVYRQVDVAGPSGAVLDRLREGQVDWVLLSSSRMASGFFGWLDQDQAAQVRRHTRLVSISPVTSATIRASGFSVDAEAPVFTLEGLLDTLVARVASLQLQPGFQPLPQDHARRRDDEDIGDQTEPSKRDAQD